MSIAVILVVAALLVLVVLFGPVAALVLLALLVGFVLFGPSGVDGRNEAERYEREERSRMPPELATARLVLSEHKVVVHRPAKVVACTDQVYLVGGELVPVETKTRDRDAVYPYDRIEISAQAFALRHGNVPAAARYPVASYGYIRVVLPGGRVRFHRVELLPDDAIVAMRQRRLQLEAGQVTPAGPQNVRVCVKCVFRDRCPRQRT